MEDFGGNEGYTNKFKIAQNYKVITIYWFLKVPHIFSNNMKNVAFAKKLKNINVALKLPRWLMELLSRWRKNQRALSIIYSSSFDALRTLDATMNA